MNYRQVILISQTNLASIPILSEDRSDQKIYYSFSVSHPEGAKRPKDLCHWHHPMKVGIQS